MARRVLQSPEYPGWVNRLLACCEFAASLKLAVVLIFSAVVMLAWGTFAEGWYGAQAARYLVYGTWWFASLVGLLAVNIFAAAAIRYPWQRHQTGFVVTHIGLLTLLYGCWLMHVGGIDAQLAVFERDRGSIAVEEDQFFSLNVERRSGTDAKATPEPITVPFLGGPINWEDLDNPRGFTTRVDGKTVRLNPWRWLRPAVERGVIYDQDGIRLEVLDYYSNARLRRKDSLVELRVSMPPMSKRNEDGTDAEPGPVEWTSVPLVESTLPPEQKLMQQDSGYRQKLGGGSFVFMRARSELEVQGFLRATPQEPLGEKGQVVLLVDGTTYPLQVHECLDKGRQPLGTSGLTAEVSGYVDSIKAVTVVVRRGEDVVQIVRLLADFPEFVELKPSDAVYTAYWYQHQFANDAERMPGKARSRVDILEGPGEKLYYRFWKAPKVVFSGPLPTEGPATDRVVDALQMRDTTLKMYVKRFDPAGKVLPEQFSKSMRPSSALRAARVKLTVDEAEREFWVLGKNSHNPLFALYGEEYADEEQVVSSSARTVRLRLELRQVDLGVDVELDKFERRLDPGTSQASHYSSWVRLWKKSAGSDAADRLSGDELVTVTMNAPIDFTDPGTGKAYRLYQEGFQPDPERGAWGPGTLEYERKGRPDLGRPEVYLSVFAVNYNPGRGFIFAGCLLVVAGIATMFYMKAYFFTGKKHAAEEGVLAKGRSRAGEGREAEKNGEERRGGAERKGVRVSG